jgi:CRISPR-associated protein (TIGR02710 family)
MNPETNTPATRAALVSVGGTPAPVLHTLKLKRPAHVWYFCSTESRPLADQIQAQLEWRPAPRFIEVARFEELGPCYRELRRKLPDILRETKVPPAEVLVDYTGGAKTMSAALVLAATELFNQFSYIGGSQRDKQGLGITLDGKERVFYQDNPWRELAVREVERARDLWAGCQFDAAANVLRDAAGRVPQEQRFETVADVAEAMAARHRLDFPEAWDLLGRARGKLPLLFDGRDDDGLLEFVRSSQALCERCQTKEAHPDFLRELLDNALRTAAQGRFEDAAARLYRAMEMQGQIWLKAATNGLFVNGRCKAADVNKLPAQLKALSCCQPDDCGEIRLGLEDLYRALAALNHDRAKAVVADIEAKDASGRTRSRWRAATEKRNASILAHGVQAIGRDGFDNMKAIASEFLEFDLAHEANPIPALNPRWLE